MRLLRNAESTVQMGTVYDAAGISTTYNALSSIPISGFLHQNH